MAGEVGVQTSADRDGIVTTRPVPLEQPRPYERAANYRKAFHLSGGFAADSGRRIVAGQPIRIVPGAPFQKFGVLIRNAGADGFIGLDRIPTNAAGNFDDVCIGNAERNERCEDTNEFWIVFPVVPADPVLVVLYAGEQAKPT